MFYAIVSPAFYFMLAIRYNIYDAKGMILLLHGVPVFGGC